jgi:hypothetical protein
MKDFVSKIRYYQRNPKKLAAVAKQGYNFVRENFARRQVAETFWNDMEKLLKQHNLHGKVVIRSSFVKKPNAKAGNAYLDE